jgi:hypothetical protein
MFKSLLRDRTLIILILLSLVLKVFSLSPNQVERYYTYGCYPWISRILRTLLGWMPFSLGDLLYAVAFIYVLRKVWNFIRVLAAREVKKYLTRVLLRKYLKVVLSLYLVFNLFWGLNYDRKGIADQLQLEVNPYTKEEIAALADLLQQRLCVYGDKTDSIRRLQLDRNKELFSQGVTAYKTAEKEFPFLRYRQPSIKASLLTPFGHLFGFTGYYNPFTGEAQLKTSVPVFLKPFIVCHEMAHQLGYAKENEANFAGFLAARKSPDPEFVYSAYFEMYTYAMRELYKTDREKAFAMSKTRHPQVSKDRLAFIQYLTRSKNPVEPFVTGIYDNYLKLNNQPNGKLTYDEVVSWLIAYMKKYGVEAI